MKNKAFISGKFNIVHPGHLRLFRFAKSCAYELVVGVESDRIAGKGAHISELDRLEMVKRINLVDRVILVDSPISEIIDQLRPDLVIKGKEYEEIDNPETEALEKYGGELVFSSGESIFSSSDLISKEILSAGKTYEPLPSDFLKRHGIKFSNLIKIIKNYETIKVCVIGDVIVDEYIECEPLGMSQEDATIVVKPSDIKRFIGGSGIVAAHAKTMGAAVEYISVIGNDSVSTFVEQAMSAWEINCSLYVDELRPTTLKKRYRSKGRTMFRVNSLSEREISTDIQDKILQKFESIVEKLDLLIFSDFNYGCLPQGLLDKLIAVGKKNDLCMTADSQTSSQIGNISRFKEMRLITPTEYEARVSLGNRVDGLDTICKNLNNVSKSDNIFLKLGENGVLVFKFMNDIDQDLLIDRFPRLNNYPQDVSGAGDSMLVAASMALSLGSSIWEAAVLGSVASAIQVGRIGNIPITQRELFNFLNK